jgi:hypothetical protein
MSKCYDNPEFDDQEPETQNTWKQSIPKDNFDNALESFKESLIKKCDPTLSEKLEKVVSKEPSKFWSESDERVRIKEEKKLREAFDEIYDSIDFREFDFASFKLGVKWGQQQDENKYSEEDMRDAHQMGAIFAYGKKEVTREDRVKHFEGWFNQIKNK